MTNINRGSQWRKWDLHFHTPSSYDYEDKSITNQQIIDTLIAKDISAVAITDHHKIDVERIKDLKRLAKDRIAIFPGIECCSELGGSESVHFIGIFPENSDIEHLWTQIQVKLKISDKERNEKGENRVSCDLIDSSKVFHELGGIVTVHAGKKSNSIEHIKNTTFAKEELKTNLLSKYVDILEVGKVEQCKVYKEVVFPNIKLIRPIILCSDNHNINNYAPSECCWIKSDLTFIGLKQIMYEPEERVSLLATKPDDKASYHLISAIHLAESGFWQDTVYLNKGLNTIIGGRSTGKSTLLTTLAMKLGCIPSSNLYNGEDNDEYKKFIEAHISGVTVEWWDPVITKGEIEFYPQHYMYRIAEQKEQTDKVVENVISSTEYQKYRDQYSTDISLTTTNVRTLLMNQEEFLRKHNQYQSYLSVRGDKVSVAKEIEHIKQVRQELCQKNALREEEQGRFEQIQKKIADNEEIIRKTEKDLELLKPLEVATIFDTSYPIRHNFASLTYCEELTKEFESLKSQTEILWAKFIKQLKDKTVEKKSQAEIEIAEIKGNELYKKGLQTILSNKELQAIEERLSSELKKYNEIVDCEKLFNANRVELEKNQTEILKAHKGFSIQADTLCQNLHFEHKGLKVVTAKTFKRTQMDEFLSSRLNLRGNDRQNFISDILQSYEDDINITVNKLLEAVRNNTLDCKGGNTPWQVLTEFMTTNWFHISYKLSYQSDDFSQMSSGKKAFVILILLLEFSKKKCPILIDQPEDSLDNRAIFKELVAYLRKKKQERQIILVTHNPNVVVGADAENVIVANQQGVGTQNDNGVKFQYVNGSIENTYTSKESKSILKSQGIREHICEILEGGVEAFKTREQKYGFTRTQ